MTASSAHRGTHRQLYTVDLDVVGILATPVDCPRCQSPDLVPCRDAGAVAFACGRCARVWHPEAGTLTNLQRFAVGRDAIAPGPPPQRSRP